MLALGPLMLLLLAQGGLFPVMTAVPAAFFGAILISHTQGMEQLIDEGLTLRGQNADLMMRPQNEKNQAILARGHRPRLGIGQVRPRS